MVDDNGTHMNAKQPSRERILVNRDNDDEVCFCIEGILALRKGTIFGDENNHGDLESISLLLEEHVRQYFGGHYAFVEKQLDREATQ